MLYSYTKLIRRIDPFQRVFPEIIDPKKSFDLGPIIVISSRSIHRVSLNSENPRRFPFTNVYFYIFFSSVSFGLIAIKPIDRLIESP